MTFSQALHKIHKHWKVLPHESKPSHEAVWIRIPPTDETSEGDEEWIGMRGDGSLVWAYASGFVHSDSNPETASRKEVKVWQFDRKDMPQQWKEALITFADTVQPISRPVPVPARSAPSQKATGSRTRPRCPPGMRA